MTERLKWTDRKFEFNFPTGIYPELIERLRGAPVRLEEHCASLPASSLVQQLDGRWSIQENAGHLFDLESLVQERIAEYVANSKELHAADMSNRKTYDAHHNEISVERILMGFRAARTQTCELLETLEAEVFGRVALHPRLQVEMRLVDMMFFQAEHDDYHLARISELKRALSN